MRSMERKMKISSRYKERAERARKSPEYWTERSLLELVRQFVAVMKASGVTQKELAERVEKKPSFVSRVFSGHHNLTVATANLLASALDMHVELKLERNVKAEKKPVYSVTTDSAAFVPRDGVIVKSRRLELVKVANESITSNVCGTDEVRKAA